MSVMSPVNDSIRHESPRSLVLMLRSIRTFNILPHPRAYRRGICDRVPCPGSGTFDRGGEFERKFSFGVLGFSWVWELRSFLSTGANGFVSE